MQTRSPQELTIEFHSSTHTDRIIFRFPAASLTKITCHRLSLHLKQQRKHDVLIQFSFMYLQQTQNKIFKSNNQGYNY